MIHAGAGSTRSALKPAAPAPLSWAARLDVLRLSRAEVASGWRHPSGVATPLERLTDLNQTRYGCRAWAGSRSDRPSGAHPLSRAGTVQWLIEIHAVRTLSRAAARCCSQWYYAPLVFAGNTPDSRSGRKARAVQWKGSSGLTRVTLVCQPRHYSSDQATTTGPGAGVDLDTAGTPETAGDDAISNQVGRMPRARQLKLGVPLVEMGNHHGATLARTDDITSFDTGIFTRHDDALKHYPSNVAYNCRARPSPVSFWRTRPEARQATPFIAAPLLGWFPPGMAFF